MAKSQEITQQFTNVYVITVEIDNILFTGYINETNYSVDAVFATLKEAKMFANRVFREECKRIIKDWENPYYPNSLDVHKHTYGKGFKNGVVYMRLANISDPDADVDEVTNLRLSVKVYEVPFRDI